MVEFQLQLLESQFRDNSGRLWDIMSGRKEGERMTFSRIDEINALCADNIRILSRLRTITRQGRL